MDSIFVVDDKDLDDAALWAVIDSAAAAASATSSSRISAVTNNNLSDRKPATLRCTTPQILLPSPSPSPSSSHRKFPQTPNHYTLNRSVRVPAENYNRPQKVAKYCVSEMSESSPEMCVVKRVNSTTPVFASPEVGRFSGKEMSPYLENNSPQIEHRGYEDKDTFRHCLSGRFPTVSLFKDYQEAALAILDKSDYTMISGNPFIKKSGWRKIAFYFNISFEIKDKTFEFDDNRNIQRAEFTIRAHMQGGRFSDGWGSCERREKKFNKPNNDIPSTAETRAKNKACQDLVGIGAYRNIPPR